jgi:hypothetical protein
MSDSATSILRRSGEQLAGIGSMLVSQGEILTDLATVAENRAWMTDDVAKIAAMLERIAKNAAGLASDALEIAGAIERETTEK